ncbi:ABCB family ABC transporter ATP-binding protein/permease [Thermaurantiacus tibetensis]|uniref:ABCB family ABC transporter ATP-binding protein/permease n=1 Tax=Thermaurantiacus tibetensis TaxID=2759035 RepID=UPI00188E9C28|nr:ABC transporter ATP-binding protein/permease [Thermaurantiacus tibetensis]
MSPPHAAPLPEAGAGDADLRTIRRFLPYLWPAGRPDLKARVVVALVLVLAAKAVLLAMPFALKAIVDGMGSAEKARDEAAALVLGMVAAYALARLGATAFDNLRNVVFERVGQQAWLALALEVFRHLHALSLRFHLERRTGSLAKVIERGTKSIDTMLYLLLFSLAPVIIELVAVTAIFALRIGPGLALATLAMVAVYALFTWRVTAWRTALRRRSVELDSETSARAVDSLLNFETVKYFNAEAREAAAYAKVSRAYAEAALRTENSLAVLNIGQALITSLMLGGAMAWTVLGWRDGRFTAGDVILVQALLLQLFRPLDILGMVYREVKQGLVDMGAMFKLLDTPAEIVDAPGARPLVVTRGELVFDAVRFAYDPAREILKGVSFRAPPGSRIAIVGPSGAGKSTLARLLFRFYDVTAGAIRIDGQDIRWVTQESLRRAIGIVPQDAVLFNDTLLWNIAYGREGASEAEIRAAIRIARLDALVARLPEGLATRVGERGLKLSGGEKQRVAIARAVLKDPPILVLDEATSALDSATEAEIGEALVAAGAGRTTLVIAHRLSTVVDADRILVMEDGRIVEEGTHAELIARDGIYRAMWDLQAVEAQAVG